MRKFLAIYTLIGIFLLSVIVIFASKEISENSTYLDKIDEVDISFQVVNTKYSDFILTLEKDEYDNVEIGNKSKKINIIKTAFNDNSIWYLYNYIDNKDIINGIGRYDTKSKENYLNDISSLKNYTDIDFIVKDSDILCLVIDYSTNTLLEFNIDQRNNYTCKKVQEFSCEEERLFFNSCYYKNNINVCLDNKDTYYYKDGEVVFYDKYEKSPFVNSSVNELHKDFEKYWKRTTILKAFKEIILKWALCFVILGIILWGIMCRTSLITKVYMYSQLFFLIIIVMVTGVYTISVYDNYMKNVELDSHKLLDNITDKMSASGQLNHNSLYDIYNNENVIFDNVLCIELKDDNYKLKDIIRNQEDILENDNLIMILDELSYKNNKIQGEIKKETNSYLVYADLDDSLIGKEFITVGLVNKSIVIDDVLNCVQNFFKKILSIYLLMNLIFSIVCVIYLLRWKRFSDALIKIVSKPEEVYNLKAAPNGVFKEWAALERIQDSVGKVTYEKNLNTEIYNKYIPVDSEKIVDKKSVLDVEIGDSLNADATVATIGICNEKCKNVTDYVNTISSSFNIINENQKDKNGIMISQYSDLTITKVLFRDSIEDAVDFSVETLLAFEEDDALREISKVIIVNYSNYDFGITGDENKYLPYIFAPEDIILSKYIELFRRAGVNMILTENTVSRCTKYSVRNIGYISDSGYNIKVYECMDAYPKLQKELLLSTYKLFKKALGLYYTNDFYLARNTFSEVLKKNPKDNIARWYLFNCENNLNNTSLDDIKYGLFENRIYEQLYQSEQYLND